MQKEKVRVRFAPSPTGSLHIGGARTALFNWLFARHFQGSFILRIEDTDLSREQESSLSSILEDLQWLGLSWDEGPGTEALYGPYFQSQRLKIYEEYAKKLLEENNAYYCYCAVEELRERRKEALSQGQAPKYDGRCRNLSAEQIKNYKREGMTAVIRFKSPNEGETHFSDLIHGLTVFQNTLLDDFVIMKSNGLPAYNFANVIDDHLMKITHVIRGDEHLSNTPRQIFLYQALGIKPPLFAHIPLIHASDHTPLSKRHGAVSIMEYRKKGYLAEAMLNYLVLLGWSPDGLRQMLKQEEIIREFSLERVSKGPAVFALDKLTWINGEYLKNMDLDKKTNLVIDYLKNRDTSHFHKEISSFLMCAKGTKDREGMYKWLKEIVRILGDRLKIISNIEDYGLFFFTDEIKIAEGDESIFQEEKVKESLKKSRERFANLSFSLEEFDSTVGEIEKIVREVAQDLGVKAKVIIHPLRLAISGKTVGPGLFESLALLGKEKTLQRLDNVLAFS